VVAVLIRIITLHRMVRRFPASTSSSPRD
jgi:hypothetical protein